MQRIYPDRIEHYGAVYHGRDSDGEPIISQNVCIKIEPIEPPPRLPDDLECQLYEPPTKAEIEAYEQRRQAEALRRQQKRQRTAMFGAFLGKSPSVPKGNQVLKGAVRSDGVLVLFKK